MKIIGIESSSLVASVALVEDEKTLGQYTVDHRKTHSQTLLPMLDELLRMTETPIDAVDAVAVASGPGSFTGLRIGAATAKGLCLAAGKPLIAVPTLEAMAYSFWGARGPVCPILDARRSQVYTALYRFDEAGRMQTLQEAQAVEISAVIEWVRRAGEPVVFLGDGIPVQKETLQKELGALARFAPAHLARQQAAAVAALGLEYFREGKTVDADRFAPEYLRISQAERERAKRLAAQEDA